MDKNKFIVLERLKDTIISVKNYIDEKLTSFLSGTVEAIEEVNTRVDEIELTPGPQGETGATYVPSVNSDGDISWTKQINPTTTPST